MKDGMLTLKEIKEKVIKGASVEEVCYLLGTHLKYDSWKLLPGKFSVQKAKLLTESVKQEQALKTSFNKSDLKTGMLVQIRNTITFLIESIEADGIILKS